MSAFDGIDDVTVSESLPYIEPGNYVLSVDRMLVGTSSRQGKGDFFVSEFTVESSTRADRPPGTRMGWPLFFNKGEITLVNIKAMVAAVAQVAHEKITKKVMDTAVEGDGTRLATKKVVCQATASETRDGRPFTKMTWSHYTEGQSFEPQAVVTTTSAGSRYEVAPAESDGSFSDDEIPF